VVPPLGNGYLYLVFAVWLIHRKSKENKTKREADRRAGRLASSVFGIGITSCLILLRAKRAIKNFTDFNYFYFASYRSGLAAFALAFALRLKLRHKFGKP